MAMLVETVPGSRTVSRIAGDDARAHLSAAVGQLRAGPLNWLGFRRSCEPSRSDIVDDINRRCSMVSIVIRDLDASVKARLVAQASQHGRSMESEAREIIARGTEPRHIGVALLDAVRAAGAVESLPLPPRDDVARVADLG
ncbi:hypothetical protein MT346_01070 [Curtobacterium sp. VKM Ac-2922]|nr:hypothetical protein [Curtobacterium sp. VKM Ac-2922]